MKTSSRESADLSPSARLGPPASGELVRPTLLVRLAEKSDVPVLLDMMVEFNRLEEVDWSREEGTRALGTLVGDSSLGLVALLREGDATVGYFIVTWGFDLEWNGRDAFLTEMFIIAPARGRRLGGAALAHAERVAKENGARALHLMVRHENEIARRLYSRAGYASPLRVFLTKPLS